MFAKVFMATLAAAQGAVAFGGFGGSSAGSCSDQCCAPPKSDTTNSSSAGSNVDFKNVDLSSFEFDQCNGDFMCMAGNTIGNAFQSAANGMGLGMGGSSNEAMDADSEAAEL